MRPSLLGTVAASVMTAVGLVCGALVFSAPAKAGVTCPAVDPSTRAVTPAPAPGVDWQGCDLDGADLSGANLANANLSQAGIASVNLENADLAGANLGAANVEDTDATGATFAGATLTTANLDATIMPGDDLRGADLTGANLYAANMGNADLTDAIMTSVDLDFTNLYGAHLTGVTSGGIIITSGSSGGGFLPDNWTLALSVSGGKYLAGPGANLANTNQVNLTSADLAGADLAGSVKDGLSGANLTGADLAGATLPYLRGSNLTNADLTDANLTNSNLDLSTVSGATFTGTNLTGASGWGTTGTPAALPSPWVIASDCLIGPTANLTECSLTNADLSGLDMAGANFAGVKYIQGANLTGANLSSAILTGINVSGSNFTKANLAGAQTTGSVFAGVTWDDTTCPDGTNSGIHEGGCFSPLTAPPAARPAVTAGKAGAHGWYVSPVTVTWNWSDNDTIVTSKCPAASAATVSGKAITVAASCTNLAGMTTHAAVALKIDLTRPKVTVTGVRNHQTYHKGKVPIAGCRTTETISGVSTPAKLKITTTGSHGLGRFTVTCSGAVSTAGTRQAQPQQITYTVIR
jgi:uncharacterized protein YjbI with pentapeptide repeats